MVYTFRGQSYQLHAWTGGHDGPTDTPSAGLIPELLPAFNYIRGQMYREQLAIWRAYWGDTPNRDTRQTFWNRATHDAFRTVERHGK